jgi:hypothetical protein
MWVGSPRLINTSQYFLLFMSLLLAWSGEILRNCMSFLVRPTRDFFVWPPSANFFYCIMLMQSHMSSRAQRSKSHGFIGLSLTCLIYPIAIKVRIIKKYRPKNRSLDKISWNLIEKFTFWYKIFQKSLNLN